MDRISLKAEERTILGKKVKTLRKEGKIPAHVFGKGIDTEHISVDGKNFLKTFIEAGETGLVDLKISDDNRRPVLIRNVQYDPVTSQPLHIDFYQVNLKEKVTVPVPIVLTGEEPETVHSGEAVVLQTLNEVEVEALPTDLVEKIEVDISKLKNIDEAITIKELDYDREKLTISVDPEEIVVKLAPAITEEMKKLMEEQEAEAAAAVEPTEEEAEKEAEEGAEVPSEGGEEKPTQEGEPKAAEDNSDTEEKPG